MNIAARLEPRARPGGICISDPVLDQVRSKVDLPLVRLEKPELKPIQVPITCTASCCHGRRWPRRSDVRERGCGPACGWEECGGRPLTDLARRCREPAGRSATLELPLAGAPLDASRRGTIGRAMPVLPDPTLADVERVAALADPALRNLQITQCYAELSAALAQHTGPGANWCTFATWASKQAGQTIRKEDLARTMDDLLAGAPAIRRAVDEVTTALMQLGPRRDPRDVRATVWRVLKPAGALGRASDAVARGNQKVFEEIGREFARFLAACEAEAGLDAVAFDAFCAALQPGEPPAGQDLLRRAFTAYHRARSEPDAKARAELLLLANLAIGLHEQTRLQPEIREALDAAVADPREVTAQLLAALLPGAAGWLAWLRLGATRLWGGPTPLQRAVGRLVDAARAGVRRLLTDNLLTLELANGVRLRLGEDLRGQFPASLREIANADLQALLRRVDPTPDSLRQSGAVDWADLGERLHYICDLFRCWQEAKDLFEPPFTDQQVADLEAGRLPAGPL